MNSSAKIILAIESAICGGSLSLLRDGVEVASWVGTSSVSKAEDLLVNVDAMLADNYILLSELGMIAISAGPGSFTGIRIGIATALGLKAGLGVAMSSESALKAMAFTRSDSENVIAVLPVGRNAICLQHFQVSGGEVVALDTPWTMTENEFLSYVYAIDKSVADLVLHTDLYERVTPSPSITDFGVNLAFAIGRICMGNGGVVTEPLFISKPF